jgi:hypothetical protein
VKILENLALRSQDRGAPSSLFPILVALLALVACKALDLGIAASVGVVAVTGMAAAAFYVGVHGRRARRSTAEPDE